MTRTKINKVRGVLLVLTALSLVLTIGSMGAMEMGAISAAWGVIKSVMCLAATAFLTRCTLAACLGV